MFARRGLKPFAAAPRPEPMHGASSHPSPRNVASLRSRNQARFSCLISDSSLLLTDERRFAPTTVRYRRISVRYESEWVSDFIGIRIRTPQTSLRDLTSSIRSGSMVPTPSAPSRLTRCRHCGTSRINALNTHCWRPIEPDSGRHAPLQPTSEVLKCWLRVRLSNRPERTESAESPG